MSPAASHFVVAMARATNLMRFAAKTAAQSVRRNVPAYGNLQTQAIFARLSPGAGRQPIHRAAWLKQTKRLLSTTRAALNSALYHTGAAGAEASFGSVPLRQRYASSKVAFAISQSTGHSAFASTLRPNLTGGAFPRTAGGYALGTGKAGAKRFFSHGPQPAAQVIENVSQAMRAFLLQGKRAQYDGTDKQGRPKWRAVSPLQAKAVKQMKSVPKASPGSWVEFGVNPTITAISSKASPLGGIAGYYSDDEGATDRLAAPTGSDGVGLQTEGLFDVLKTDFSRALRELALVMADIQAMSSLGDLPISYDPRTGRLRIHFPGTDAETVEKLASELGVQRGLIGQDADFDAFIGTEVALMFPFASSPISSLPASLEDQQSETESERLCGMTAYVNGAEIGSDISERAPSPNAEDDGSTVSSFPDTFDEPSSLSDGSAFDPVDVGSLDDPWAPGTSRERRLAASQLLGTISPGSGQTVSDLGSSRPSSPSPRSLRRAMYDHRSNGRMESSAGTPLEYSTDFEGLYRFIEMCDQRRA